jgi:hypothetical protein
MDTIDRLPQTGEKGIYLKQQLKDKLVEHRLYIDKNGQDMPEIRNWKWPGGNRRHRALPGGIPRPIHPIDQSAQSGAFCRGQQPVPPTHLPDTA